MKPVPSLSLGRIATMLAAIFGVVICSAHTTASPLNAHTLDLFDSLENGAGIYLCKIVKRETNTNSSSVHIERGEITLNVFKTILGTNRTRFVLGYAFYPSTARLRGSLIWPGWMDKLSISNVLCVVVPRAEDPTTPRIPEVNEAASLVIPISTDRAKEVRDIEVVCRLHNTTNSQELVKLLRKAVFHKHEIVSNFAMRTVVSKLGREDPDNAIKLLKLKAASYKDDSEARWLLYSISHNDDFNQPNGLPNQFFFRSLAAIAQSPSVSVREQVAFNLGNRIRSLGVILPDVQILGSLSAKERAALDRALEAALNSKDDSVRTNSAIAVAKQWLSK